MKTIVENSDVLGADLAGANYFDIRRLFGLELGASQSAEVPHVFGHVLFSAVLLHNKDTTVLAVDPVTFVQIQVLAEVEALTEGLQAL